MAEKYITKTEKLGNILISDDVVTALISDCVGEVDGVSGLASTAGAEIAERVGLKTLPKGIKVQIDNDNAYVEIIITVSFGKNIVEVARNVQAEVQKTLLSTLDIPDISVNVHVSGITFDKA